MLADWQAQVMLWVMFFFLIFLKDNKAETDVKLTFHTNQTLQAEALALKNMLIQIREVTQVSSGDTLLPPNEKISLIRNIHVAKKNQRYHGERRKWCSGVECSI